MISIQYPFSMFNAQFQLVRVGMMTSFSFFSAAGPLLITGPGLCTLRVKFNEDR